MLTVNSEKVIRKIVAEILNTERVQSFKKDFLTLMKNLPRVTDFNVALELNKHMDKWRNDFEDYVFKYLLKDIESLKHDDVITEKDFLYWNNYFRKELWNFVIQFQLPLSLNEYLTEDQRFKDYQAKVGKWEAKIRGLARVTWGQIE